MSDRYNAQTALFASADMGSNFSGEPVGFAYSEVSVLLARSVCCARAFPAQGGPSGTPDIVSATGEYKASARDPVCRRHSALDWECNEPYRDDNGAGEQDETAILRACASWMRPIAALPGEGRCEECPTDFRERVTRALSGVDGGHSARTAKAWG